MITFILVALAAWFVISIRWCMYNLSGAPRSPQPLTTQIKELFIAAPTLFLIVVIGVATLPFRKRR